MADTRVQGGFLLTDFQGRFLLTDSRCFIPGNWTSMSLVGVYAAGLGMPVPGLSTLHHPLALGSWGKDVVCHKGLGGVFCVSGSGPVYRLEYLLLAQLALSRSFLV